MTGFPVEIVSAILAEACFDDKATGCVLALTSKWISEVAKPVRFQAVSLYGVSQMMAFSKLFEGSTSANTPKIRHLFVSGIGPKQAEMRRDKRMKVLRKLAIGRKLLEKSDEDEEDVGSTPNYYPWLKPDEEVEGIDPMSVEIAVHKIILGAASSIETLFLATMPPESRYSLIVTLPCALPNLTEFSVTGNGCNFVFPDRLPSLKRVHFDPGSIALGPPNILPVLQELRYTGFSPDRRTTPPLLDVLLDHARSVMPGGPDFASVLPITLKRVVLQHTPPPYGARCGTSYIQHGCAADHLYSTRMAVNELKDATGFEVVELPEPTLELWAKGKIDGLAYNFEDARKDWMMAIRR